MENNFNKEDALLPSCNQTQLGSEPSVKYMDESGDA